MDVNNLFSLKGKNAFVTGATGYLGEQICLGLASVGAHVIVQGRNLSVVNLLINKIERLGGTAEAAIFDLLDEQATRLYFEESKLLKLNVLVNNAYNGTGGTISHSEDAYYRESYEIGLIVVQRLFKLFTPAMLQAFQEDNLASCINIASMYGQVAPDLDIYDSAKGSNPPFYGAVKAALIQWTKYAACEFGKHGIRVNCISPGPFPNVQVQKSSPEFVAKLAQKVPLSRIGQSKELQGSIIYLASYASSFVNGINLQVDGGWTCL
jgi:NAD(P)-dependent dehydrogenase (short-subunit alcohol dehydrogenase family)